MIDISITVQSNPRGPGFWKLNTSFLTEIEHVNQIKSTIQAVKEEYQNDDTMNHALLWEMIKMKAREQSLKYAAAKKAKALKREEDLEKAINNLQLQIETTSDNEGAKQLELERKKAELENIIEYRTKGAILRSKCRWYNEGERNTKYFLNMEKRHYKQGVISQLKTNDDETVNSGKEILNQCESFYKTLYSSQMNINDTYGDDMFFDKNNTKILNPDEQMSCEGLLTKAECLQALKNTEANKTPGSDGIPAEFYKVFWNDLSDLLVNSINFAYRTGQFSVTQRRGIIKLIPKKDTVPYFIKNWRPITLSLIHI